MHDPQRATVIERLRVKCLIGAAHIVLALAAASTAADIPSAVERDWLLAAQLASGSSSAVTPEKDAAGGCDGVKSGTWGFHTDRQKEPWWQVDLGRSEPIGRIVVWNRGDAMADRAAALLLKLSDDGKSWRTAYRHGGNLFGGLRDGGPLSIAFTNQSARFVRVQLPTTDFLHLDEVEVFSAREPARNLALHRPANQSSVSQWSVSHVAPGEPRWAEAARRAADQCQALENERAPRQAFSMARALSTGTSGRDQYLAARALLRKTLLSDPLLDFDDLLFVKRMPGTFSHMSDQYYGWWSRPGGGVFILKQWKSEQPKLVALTDGFGPGSFLKPELSYDGKRILFSYCRYHPGVRENTDKTRKKDLPEDAFYHVFEMNADGTHVRQLTRGHYDDFSARFLPDGQVVFLSTRRGTFLQKGNCVDATTHESALPDSYVRCGGDNWRPVAVYTLHVMEADGANMRAISPFENFEWDPVVANDGRIVYARWDYVDRDNMPYMSLWSTNPDGTNPQLVYGNHTRLPYGVFEARPVPNSRKFVFTASAHHSISGGSLCLLDADYGNEDAAPLTRLTPEVPFPEVEGWSDTWYATPYPLSEKLFLTAWSAEPLHHEGQSPNNTNALGLYVYHAGGARELIYRDPNISCSDPIPLRARTQPPRLSALEVARDDAGEGRFLLLDVYQGLVGVPRGTVKALRVIGVPPKVQPQMNRPNLGLTIDDPGKFILGTAPVEPDGSAHFRAPAGVNIFFQALNERGLCVQTMRTVTYVQAGQTLSCVGCHEHRSAAPDNRLALAARRTASKLIPGPDGAWPFRFDRLVGRVLEDKCVRCHQPGFEDPRAARLNLTGARAYETLVSYGKPSLREQVRRRYFEGRSMPNDGTARGSVLLGYLERDALHAPLLSANDRERLVTWLDVYGQRVGSFSDQQEQQLAELKARLSALLEVVNK